MATPTVTRLTCGPAVRQVLDDGADALGLVRLGVPSEATSPHVELAGLCGIRRRTGTPDPHLLPSGPRLTGDLGVRVDRAFQDASVSVDVDDERVKMVQKEGRPGIQLFELVLHGLDSLTMRARLAAVQP